MATYANLAALRGEALQMADMANTVTAASSPQDVVNTGFVPVSEANKYINQGYKYLYGLLTLQWENFFNSTYDFQLQANQEDYDLPTDFQHVIGVDLLPGGDTKLRITIAELGWQERNRYRSFFFTYLGKRYEWHLFNNSMRISPVPSGQTGDAIRMYYVPSFTPLVDDTDVVATMPQLDEFITTYAAIRMVEKQEQDSTHLQRRLEKLEELAVNIGKARQVATVRAVARVEDDYLGQLNVGIYEDFY